MAKKSYEFKFNDILKMAMVDFTELFAWGDDKFGQLGLGDKRRGENYCIPRF